MKSIFTKLGKMLLCGVAFAVVGCTDYDTDIQKIAGDVAQAEVTIAELQDAIDALEAKQAQLEADYAKKADLEAAKASLEQKLNDKTAELKALVDALASSAATKEELAELQGKVNEAIEAANAEIAKLQAALDTKASKEDVEILKEGYQQTIEKFQNLELILAGKADQADVDLVAADVATLKEGYQQTVAALTQIDADITALENQVGDNTSEIAALQTASAQAVLAITNLEGKVTGILRRVDVLEEQVKSLMQGYQETVAALTQIKSDIENLQDGVSDNADNIKKLQEAYKLLNDKVTNFEMAYRVQVNNIDARIDALEEVAETFKAEYPGIVNAVTNHTTAIETLTNEVDGLKSTISALEKKYDEAISQIEELFATKVDKALFDATIAYLTEELSKVASIAAQVPELLARVQSLVYVPDYSDHKATIQWALVNNGIQALNLEEAPAYTVLAKTSELKYLVKANTPADAESAAKAIEIAWEEVLDYLVEPVKIRTRSEEAVADLEIVGVTAKDDVVTVSVVAKNFDYEFFNNPEEGIYSAAIVLKDDKGNNLTSEYTNLVPGVAEEYQMALFVYEEDPQTADETLRMTGNDEVITYLISCNDTVTVKSAVKPFVGFVPVIDGVPAVTTPVSFYTPELLAEEGYDVAVDMDITLVDTENHYVHDGTMDTKPGPIHIDDYFNIEGGNPVHDFHYSVKPGVSFENKGKYSTVTYTFTCGNTVQNLTYRIELANAQVAVNISTDIDWTVALYSELYNSNSGAYANSYVKESVAFEAVGGPVAHMKPVLNDPAKVKSVKAYVKDATGEWKEVDSALEARAFILSAFNEDQTVDIQLQGGNYSWNNSYKVVWETVNDAKNVDYTTTAIVNLVNRPEKIEVPVDATYTLNGKESYFRAEVDLFGESFKQVEKYLGYETPAADTAKWKAVFSQNILVSLTDDNLPLVNEKPGRVSTLYNLEQARLSILEHNNGRYTIKENEANVITWTGNTYFGVPVEFTVTGKVVLPTNALIYSDDYVTNATAEVYGQIQGGTYNIIKSDLAKYFNVSEELDGHEFTVEFEVVSPVDAVKVEDKHGNANLVADVTDKNLETPVPAYNGLQRDTVILDWADYNGLEVKVNATLKVNGFERGSLPLTLVTKDPLTLTGEKEFEVQRQLRKDLKVQVFQKLVLTSSIAPDNAKENLIVFKTEEGRDKSKDYAFKYAMDTYGADVQIHLDAEGVYYYDNEGKPRILGSNKYSYDETTGFLTIYGDDAKVKTYYANFTAVMTSRICGGEHTVPFRIKAVLAE